ncbi:hypothetical protein OPHB3_3547 [Oceanobacillus picturae]|jgi:hypothetical protein|uniref:Uncharacterized protein n=1 Tax=Oceanobacillus picturae TaxID=171693 RepID=A0A0U9HA53_9BACI|nr:hypothetical protein [Oceanobacillus picturae]RIU88328.1 hypothetical protein D1864_18035 [Oceanobacillus picturae]GAQ19575.1 hypothetical protein OPHB3_3547 [Oceanobacillus picturae]
MLGLLINEMEQKEVEYLLKRELEELLMDLEDHRIDHKLKRSMGERYQLLFQLFRRVASEKECLKYMPKRSGNQ